MNHTRRQRPRRAATHVILEFQEFWISKRPRFFKISVSATAETLDVSGRELESVPRRIDYLLNLRVLNLNNNFLYVLPTELGSLVLLEELNLKGNHLSDLPDSLQQIAFLWRLNLGWNQFSAVSPVVEKLTTLTRLSLADNRFHWEHLGDPQSLSRLAALTRLERLNLKDCQLPTLPNALCSLKQMRHLNISGNPKLVNPYVNVPEPVVCMPQLEVLVLPVSGIYLLGQEYIHDYLQPERMMYNRRAVLTSLYQLGFDESVVALVMSQPPLIKNPEY